MLPPPRPGRVILRPSPVRVQLSQSPTRSIVSHMVSCFAIAAVASLARASAHLVDELSDDAVPLARLQVHHAVQAVRVQRDGVVEAHEAGDGAQQVDAESLETVVAGEVGPLAQHHIGRILEAPGAAGRM